MKKLIEVTGLLAPLVVALFALNPLLPEATGSGENSPVVSPRGEGGKTNEEGQETTSPTLKGVFHLPDGRPAAGVELRVFGWGSNESRVDQFGEPENWTNPVGKTDVEGRFEIFFDPPLAYQFVLDANLAGYAEVSWRWSSLTPDKATDVGIVTLEPACSVTGFVIDSSGEPYTSGWRVHADSGEPAGLGRDSTQRSSDLDPETGQFRIENMPAGRVKLKAYSRLAGWVQGPVVVLRPDQVVEASVVYTGPDLSRRITVVSFIWCFWTLDLEPDSVQIYRREEFVGVAKKLQGSSQSYAAEGLEPGVEYTIWIQDKRFRTWSQAGIKAGESVDAHLVGSGALRLRVIDSATREPVDSYGFYAEFPNPGGSFLGEHVFKEGSAIPADRIFYGLIPTPQTLIVYADGYVTSETWIPEFRPHSTRPLTIVLSRGVSLRGRVVSPDGEGIAGALVSAAPGDVPVGMWDETAAGWILTDFHEYISQVQSDQEGHFEFRSLTPGPWSVDARWSRMAVQRSVDISDSGYDGLTIRFPRPGELVGTILGPSGQSVEGLDLLVVTRVGSAELTSPLSHQSSVGASATTDANGRFETGPLPPGDVRVLLVLPSQHIPTSSSSGRTLQPVWLELGEAELKEGQTTEATFSASRSLPGSIRLQIDLNGEAAAGAVVTALCMDDPARGPRGTTVNAKGEAFLGPVFPGVYRLEIYTLDGEWIFDSAQTLRVGSNTESTEHIEITLAEARISLVDDKTGEPLKRAWIGWSRAGQPIDAVDGSRKTNARGELKLELPIGTYAFKYLARQEPDGTLVEWTRDGPAASTARLKTD